MAQEFFRLPDGKIIIISFNPGGGRWHGWIFRVGRDGQLISERQLASYTPLHDPMFDRPASSGKDD
jgi:hypothetical protein